MKLLLRGPEWYGDIDFIYFALKDLLEGIKDITLISDVREGEAYHISPSCFPAGEEFFQKIWKRNAVREGDKRRFSTMIRYHPTKGVKKKRKQMIRECTYLVCFWDVGGGDKETEAFIKLGKLYDVKMKVIRI